MKNKKGHSYVAVLIAIATLISVSMPYVAFSETVATIGRDEAIERALVYNEAMKTVETAEKELLKSLNTMRSAANEARGFQREIDELKSLLGDDFPAELTFNSEESYDIFYQPQLAEPQALLQYEKTLHEKSLVRSKMAAQVDALMVPMFALKAQLALSEKKLDLEQKQLDALVMRNARGEIASMDVSRAKLEQKINLAQFEQLMISYENATLALKMLLGIDGDVEVNWVNDYERLVIVKPMAIQPAKAMALEKRSEVILAGYEVKAAQSIVAIHQQFYYKKYMRPEADLELVKAKNALKAAQNEVVKTLAATYGDVEAKRRSFERESEKYEDLRADYLRDQLSFEAGKITTLGLENAKLTWESQYAVVIQAYVDYALASEALVQYYKGER